MNPGRLLENNKAWERGQALEVHGWIYDLADGLLRDLNCTRKGMSHDR